MDTSNLVMKEKPALLLIYGILGRQNMALLSNLAWKWLQKLKKFRFIFITTMVTLLYYIYQGCSIILSIQIFGGLSGVYFGGSMCARKSSCDSRWNCGCLMHGFGQSISRNRMLHMIQNNTLCQQISIYDYVITRIWTVERTHVHRISFPWLTENQKKNSFDNIKILGVVRALCSSECLWISNFWHNFRRKFSLIDKGTSATQIKKA